LSINDQTDQEVVNSLIPTNSRDGPEPDEAADERPGGSITIEGKVEGEVA
jgi:hypothetical protein